MSGDDNDDFEPALPYNGTEGYSGSETSKESAMADAVNGIASVRQRYILINAFNAAENGVTVSELRDVRLHHGRVSGGLSSLHKVGRLARLKETRGRCKIYVLPEYVGDRETEPFGRKPHRASKEVLDAAGAVDRWLHRHDIGDGLFDLSDVIEHDDDLFEAMQTLVNYAEGRVE